MKGRFEASAMPFPFSAVRVDFKRSHTLMGRCLWKSLSIRRICLSVCWHKISARLYIKNIEHIDTQSLELRLFSTESRLMLNGLFYISLNCIVSYLPFNFFFSSNSGIPRLVGFQFHPGADAFILQPFDIFSFFLEKGVQHDEVGAILMRLQSIGNEKALYIYLSHMGTLQHL